jgi:hypothetical protein
MEKVIYQIENSENPLFKTISISGNDGKKQYLHSRIDPSREVESLQSAISCIAKDTVIAVGCGFGYHLLPVAENEGIKTLIVIDFLSGLESFVLQADHFKKLSVSSNVIFLSGLDQAELEKELAVYLDIDVSKGIYFLEHPASVRIFTDYYKSVRETIDRVLRKKIGNTATKRSFDHLFLRNIIKRMPYFRNLYPLSSIRNVWKGKPSLILSSAPSIDKYIDTIVNHRNSLNIIAIDSAYPVLFSKNIKPDLIISIDPQPWIDEHLLSCDRSIPFISNLSSWCGHFQPETLFISMNSHPFSQIIDHHLPDIGTCDSRTGTVLGDAIFAARYLGSSKIFILGADFSFPHGVIYGKGTAYNYRYTSIYNSRLQTAESLHQSYINRSSRIKKNGIFTRQSFLQFMESIEKIPIQDNTCPITHIVAGGMHLSNTTLISTNEKLETVLSQLPVIADNQRISEKTASLKRFSDKQYNHILKVISENNLLDQLLDASLNSPIPPQKKDRILMLIKKLWISK